MVRFNWELPLTGCKFSYVLLLRELVRVESDEIYVGVDRNGCHYVVPVQAKGGNDKLSRMQIEQDISLCNDKLPTLFCRPGVDPV